MNQTTRSRTEAAGRRVAELERDTKAFRHGLMKLWADAGKPSPREMAHRAQISEGTFLMFLPDTALPLPNRHEVEGLLDALAVPSDVRARGLARWAELTQRRNQLDLDRIRQNRTKQGLPPEAPVNLDDLVDNAITATGPLAAALEARSREDLQSALRALRTAAKLSIQRLADATHTVPGSYGLSRSTVHRIETGPRAPTPEQVTAFAKACGQSRTEQRLWKRAAEDVARIATPTQVKAKVITEPRHTAQVELYTDRARYPLDGAATGGATHEQLRIPISKQLSFATYTAAWAAVAGAIVAASNAEQPTKSRVINFVTGIAAGAITLHWRRHIVAMADKKLTRFAKGSGLRGDPPFRYTGKTGIPASR